MNRILEIILGLTIVGLTLAFGGVETIAYSLMELVLFSLILLLLVKQTLAGEIKLPLAIAPILFILLAALQLIPLPVGLVARLSPARMADLAATPAVTWATLSVYPRETLGDLMKFLAYFCGFVVAAQVTDLRRGRSALVRLLILLGFLEAAYGIVQYLTGWQKIFTYTKKYDIEEATGTFINRNHFAGHMELVVPFVMAAMFYAFQVWSSRRHAFDRTLEDEERSSAAQQVFFYLFLLVFMVLAVIFSRSRMGILVTIFTLVILTGLAQLKVRRKAWLLGAGVSLAGVLGYGLWIGLGPVLARFEKVTDPTYLSIEGRFSIWRDTLRLIGDHPLVGTGLGTFEAAFRQYQTTLVNNLVDHAHNDYLELAADTGVIGAVLLFLPIFYLLGKMVLAFLHERHAYRRSTLLGCIGSSLGLLLHSVTDFNLHIPANALTFAVVLGMGYRLACLDRRATRQPKN